MNCSVHLFVKGYFYNLGKIKISVKLKDIFSFLLLSILATKLSTMKEEIQTKFETPFDMYFSQIKNEPFSSKALHYISFWLIARYAMTTPVNLQATLN